MSSGKDDGREPRARIPLPGEVRIALWFIGFTGCHLAFCFALGLYFAGQPGADAGVALRFSLGALLLFVAVASFFGGLWVRSVWGYWGAVLLFSAGAIAVGAMSLASFLERGSVLTAASGRIGLVRAVGAVFFVTPVLLLARARRRYFSPPSPDERSV